MADRGQQPVDDLLSPEPQLHIRQLPPGPNRGIQETRQAQTASPRDIDLHGQDHLAQGPEDVDEPATVDLHPSREVLVTSQAEYTAPPPLPEPVAAAEGLPPPANLTVEDLGFKERVPLRLIPRRRDQI